MLNKVGFKLKILVLGLLVAAAFALLAVKSISELGEFHELTKKNLQELSQNATLLSEISHAHVVFKIQVQEWKNVLIRGNDSKQYDKYAGRFVQRSDKVQEHLASAVEIAKGLNQDSSAIVSVRAEHAELKKAYLKALEQFDAGDELTGKKVDKSVSGVDRPASKAMTEIAVSTEQNFDALLEATNSRLDADYESIKSSLIMLMLISAVVVLLVMLLIFRDLLKTLGGEPLYAADVVDKIAAGQLNTEVMLASGDSKSLLFSINRMKNQLSEVIAEVRSSADSLASASEEVSATSQSLAKGASVQAASVEETSASMEQMASSIAQNNENASVTDGMAQKASSEAEVGGSAVMETVSAMQKIAEKISVIDDIAYQTNLLALNAAIEAGRAGDHGKGFAVVASEVRKLAERSQVAAQEIGELAKASVERADSAGKSLQDIVPAIRKTADLVQEIAAASSEQASGVNQINSAMGQVSQTMQQNAAASEQLSSTSEEMSAHALTLQETVDYFELKAEPVNSFTKSSRKAKASIERTKPREETQAAGDECGDDNDEDDKKFVRFE